MDQGLVAQDRGREHDRPSRYDGGDYGRPDRSDRSYGDRGRSYDGSGYGASTYGGGLLLFDRPGYGGRSFPVDRDIDNLGDMGFNDRAWSVRVRGGAWRLCADSDYRHCQVIDRDVDDLGQIGLGRNVSSVQRIR